MEAGRSHTWTDARLDDFRRDVNKRFDAVDGRLDETNRSMDAGFARVDTELHAINARFDTLNRTLLQIGATMAAALITLIAAMLGMVATQL
jgi:hypothetical protein